MQLRWVVFFALLGLFGAIYATTLGRDLTRRHDLKAYVVQRDKKKAELEDQLLRRQERAVFLKTEEGVAWTARNQLNMALPGEKIFRFTQDGEQTKVLPQASESAIIID